MRFVLKIFDCEICLTDNFFPTAMEVVTVYVFQEPSLLSVLQDNGVTEAVLNALLVKNPPATREVLASLPNIFRYYFVYVVVWQT